VEGGEEIAFLRLTGRHWQVWVMAEDGSKPRQLSFSAVDKYEISRAPCFAMAGHLTAASSTHATRAASRT
jgi:hypothetical protein